MQYRPEIDGLRALAVIPVILFHAGFDLFSGGYVGVDVFFVISGYLITTILIEDIENNRFSISNFYKRRARRILPALTFMVLVIIVMGWFILTPYFYRDLFQTTVATSVFASNILLFIKSGYFEPISELKPFLHTWSLAVEEQFYLLFPIFLILAWRFGKNRVFWIIVVLATISLLISEWSWRVNERANFYFLHTRAWELLCGSLAAFIVHKNGVQKNNALALLGLIAIVFSIFFYDEAIPFPSVYALVPVLGVVLLILYADKETLASKLLGSQAFVGIGLISYSAYLWHQPIFSLMRHSSITAITMFDYLVAIALVFIVSYLSWRFVEKPFRNKKQFKEKHILVFSFASISLMLLIGSVGHIKLGFPERLSEETKVISMGSFDKNPRQNECHYLEKLKDIESACVLGATKKIKPSIALIGNSHGDMFAKSLSDSLSELDLSAYNLSFNGCSPVNFEQRSSSFTKNKCYEILLDFLSEHREISTVIVSFRLTWPLSETEYGDELINGKQVLVTQDILNERASIVKRKLEELAKLEKNIVIIYPVPEAGEDVPNYVTKMRMISDENFTLQIPYKTFIKQNETSYAVLDSLNGFERLSRIYPSSVLCKESLDGFCKTVIRGIPVYYDDDHLSNYGASLITPSILDAVIN